MRKRLSSRRTVLQKHVLPVVWLGSLAWATAFLRLTARRTGMPFPPELKWGLVCAWGLGLAYVWFVARRLKVVWLEGDHLVVSDGRREATIPLGDIDEVFETRFRKPKLIRIRLRWGSDFGDEITFVAPVRLYVPFTEHPTVRELRGAVEGERTSVL